MIGHRARQFAQASRRPRAEDFDLARRLLTTALFALFEEQHPRDIVHSAGTARWLLARGHDDCDLLIAALLHDVGKGAQRRGDRAAWVVAGWTGLTRWAPCETSRLEVRRAMHRSAEHSRVGAAMIEAAGGPAKAVDLTLRHHRAPAGDPVLALLQQADAAS